MEFLSLRYFINSLYVIAMVWVEMWYVTYAHTHSGKYNSQKVFDYILQGLVVGVVVAVKHFSKFSKRKWNRSKCIEKLSGCHNFYSKAFVIMRLKYEKIEFAQLVESSKVTEMLLHNFRFKRFFWKALSFCYSNDIVSLCFNSALISCGLKKP